MRVTIDAFEQIMQILSLVSEHIKRDLTGSGNHLLLNRRKIKAIQDDIEFLNSQIDVISRNFQVMDDSIKDQRHA